MRERPILMSAPMVRALLAGTKTQTRRVVKRQPTCDLPPEWPRCKTFNPSFDPDGSVHCANCGHGMRQTRSGAAGIPSPYGKPGDKLWVRETFCCVHGLGEPSADDFVRYRADDEEGDRVITAVKCWKPSIFMPRVYSRITLEITEVRVQRLQDIGEEDAIAEGAFFTDYGRNCFHGGGPTDVNECPASERTHPQREGWSMVSTASHRECLGTARYAFASYFNEVNGPGSWDANNWVWALTFKLEDLCK